jgi:hypothetical protein
MVALSNSKITETQFDQLLQTVWIPRLNSLLDLNETGIIKWFQQNTEDSVDLDTAEVQNIFPYFPLLKDKTALLIENTHLLTQADLKPVSSILGYQFFEKTLTQNLFEKAFFHIKWNKETHCLQNISNYEDLQIEFSKYQINFLEIILNRFLVENNWICVNTSLLNSLNLIDWINSDTIWSIQTKNWCFITLKDNHSDDLLDGIELFKTRFVKSLNYNDLAFYKITWDLLTEIQSFDTGKTNYSNFWDPNFINSNREKTLDRISQLQKLGKATQDSSWIGGQFIIRKEDLFKENPPIYLVVKCTCLDKNNTSKQDWITWEAILLNTLVFSNELDELITVSHKYESPLSEYSYFLNKGIKYQIPYELLLKANKQFVSNYKSVIDKLKVPDKIYLKYEIDSYEMQSIREEWIHAIPPIYANCFIGSNKALSQQLASDIAQFSVLQESDKIIKINPSGMYPIDSMKGNEYIYGKLHTSYSKWVNNVKMKDKLSYHEKTTVFLDERVKSTDANTQFLKNLVTNFDSIQKIWLPNTLVTNINQTRDSLIANYLYDFPQLEIGDVLKNVSKYPYPSRLLETSDDSTNLYNKIKSLDNLKDLILLNRTLRYSVQQITVCKNELREAIINLEKLKEKTNKNPFEISRQSQYLPETIDGLKSDLAQQISDFKEWIGSLNELELSEIFNIIIKSIASVLSIDDSENSDTDSENSENSDKLSKAKLLQIEELEDVFNLTPESSYKDITDKILSYNNPKELDTLLDNYLDIFKTTKGKNLKTPKISNADVKKLAYNTIFDQVALLYSKKANEIKLTPESLKNQENIGWGIIQIADTFIDSYSGKEVQFLKDLSEPLKVLFDFSENPDGLISDFLETYMTAFKPHRHEKIHNILPGTPIYIVNHQNYFGMCTVSLNITRNSLKKDVVKNYPQTQIPYVKIQQAEIGIDKAWTLIPDNMPLEDVSQFVESSKEAAVQLTYKTLYDYYSKGFMKIESTPLNPISTDLLNSLKDIEPLD